MRDITEAIGQGLKVPAKHRSTSSGWGGRASCHPTFVPKTSAPATKLITTDRQA